MHAYFTGRTGDRDAAADLMQDVFLRVWQHLDQLADMPEDGQRAWIFTVARNLSVDSEAAAIFEQIVATPVPVTVPRLHPSWWRDYTAAFTARMIASTRPARPAA